MKFKERRGNVFVFDGGYDLEELELEYFYIGTYKFKNLIIDTSLEIETSGSTYKDIQTAVNLMTILKNEGLV